MHRPHAAGQGDRYISMLRKGSCRPTTAHAKLSGGLLSACTASKHNFLPASGIPWMGRGSKRGLRGKGGGGELIYFKEAVIALVQNLGENWRDRGMRKRRDAALGCGREDEEDEWDFA
ncbi:hypothetical protein NPIL_72121 [Nephila pilipes]|uniref:Uncharacterized protein n=1 Tax=Nephila pilipes TaxID=299642 RepID=A0A8X6NHX3_NEPPI|nr:hypothetical protein NPIL_72121 [Nephila pilipes]